MLVGERMSAPVITVEPKTPISDALMLFRQKRIRRAPVIASSTGRHCLGARSAVRLAVTGHVVERVGNELPVE
jgi:CBS domain-containing protein